MFGILKKLLFQVPEPPKTKPKQPRRTRGKGRKANGISAANSYKPGLIAERVAVFPEPEPAAAVQEGPVREPVGEAQGDEGPGEEDNREDEGWGGADREAAIARKRRSKKSKASRPD